MEQLKLTAKTKEALTKILTNTFGVLLEEYPQLAEEISVKAAAIEEKKSLSLKGLQSAFKKSGLIGKGGVFSLLTKALFKKPSTTSISPTGIENKETGLTPDVISTLPAVTPLRQAPTDTTKKKEQDLLQETQKAIPVEFAGFTYDGEADFKRVLPPLFEDILKKFFKKTDQFGTEGLTPQTDTDYGGGLLETLANLAMLKGGLRGGATAGRPRGRIRQLFRNRKAGRLRAQRTAARAARVGTPPPLPASKPVSTTTPSKTAPSVKPSKPVTTAPSAAGKAVTKAAGKGATTSIGKAAAKRIPLLGTALTAGFLGSELLETSKQEQAGEITKEEAKKQKAGAVGGAGGGLAGALGGAAVGATIGSVVPVVGTVIGGIAGGIIGGIGGEMLGRTAGETLVGDEAPALAQPESQPPVIVPTPEASETPEINIPKPIDNTNILNTIATNTGSTNEVLRALSQAIFKLAQTYETKGSKDSSNIFINGQQQNPIPSASQVAAQNVDPIRQVRMQFAV